MKRRFRKFGASESGAVAPIIALALFGLVAVGGIAFDYSRLAALDTELQNAADQAALAAATQLDGSTGAAARAVAAAQSLVANQTRFANDGSVSGIAIQTGQTSGARVRVNFYETRAQAEADTNSFTATATDADANAHFVKVEVTEREAVYALTPIVAAFSSGEISAAATAGLGSAICKVPPVMMCNPDEPLNNTNPDVDFDASTRIGFGLKLIGDGPYAPGNFGFLEASFGNGANNLLKALAYNSPPGDCLKADGVSNKTGMNASVMDGLNTRFDIGDDNACPDGGPCSPAMNVRKDLVRDADECNWEEADSNAAAMATTAPPRYRPTTAAALPTGTTPVIMGHPRDICHAHSEAGSCTGGFEGRIGDGVWDRGAYFRSNHPGVNYATESGLDANGDGKVSRYETYLWELGNPATRLEPTPFGTKYAYGAPQDGPPAMCRAPGVPASTTIQDRRRIAAAVINCEEQDVGGHEEGLTVLKWVDLFLVEPSIERKYCKSGAGCNTRYTDKKDVYVEIIGETNMTTTGATGGQVVRRDVPYLVR